MLSVTIKSNMLSIVMLPVIVLDAVTPIYLLRHNPENMSPVHTEKNHFLLLAKVCLQVCSTIYENVFFLFLGPEHLHRVSFCKK
jgi:hypothetical protein